MLSRGGALRGPSLWRAVLTNAHFRKSLGFAWGCMRVLCGMTAKPVLFDVTTRRGRERVREVWTGVRVAECSVEDVATARLAGYESDGEHFVGRDPRRMSLAELRDMGHDAMSPIAAIRAKCLDCMAGSADEVRKCMAMACPSWPFRMGKNPWRAPASEARREASRRSAARLHGKSLDHAGLTARDDGTDTDG